ncbi:LOW QUALITY PROTEIN: UBN2 domain-containing protein, partial [Cephalotus follicularis]
HVLFCAVVPNEFNRISSCDSAKEMWDLLEVSYEGTNQVKEKISMLVHEYELFMMHDNENISDMFSHFTTIINSLKNLAKDLTTLPLEQLLGSLMTHETTMKNHESEVTKVRKTIALRASKEESESDEDAMVFIWDDSDPLSSDEESDEEIANIAFMANEEEEEDEVNFSFDELQEAYENIFNEYK